MVTFAVMLAAAAALPAYNLPPKRAPAKCADRCASRYRLPSSGDDASSAKNRALAEDGGECSIVGARVCTSKPRRILTSTY